MYKPVILIGNGARGNPALIRQLCEFGAPVLTTWAGIDLVAENEPTFCGRPGILGQRAANIIQQKADLILCVGARLDCGQVAFDPKGFAPNAKKIVYDCDDNELQKLPQSNDWLKIKHDLREPLDVDIEPSCREWLVWCKKLKTRFDAELRGTHEGRYVNPFTLIGALSHYNQPGQRWVVGSSGTIHEAFMQAFRVQPGNRIISCPNIGAMGMDIPVALGACPGWKRQPTICLTGDGSFMLNVQELEVVRRENMPIVFVVANNGGYASIKQMQNVRFGGHKVGCDPESGLTMPSLDGLARAFGITYCRIRTYCELTTLESLLRYPCPVIVEVMTDPDWVQAPKVQSSMRGGVLTPDPMEDMTPHIDDLATLMEWGA